MKKLIEARGRSAHSVFSWLTCLLFLNKLEFTRLKWTDNVYTDAQHWVSLPGFLNYAILLAFIFKRFHVHSSKIMHRSSREASVYHVIWLSCSYSLSIFKALKFGHTHSMCITFISLKRWGFTSANPCH